MKEPGVIDVRFSAVGCRTEREADVAQTDLVVWFDVEFDFLAC